MTKRGWQKRDRNSVAAHEQGRKIKKEGAECQCSKTGDHTSVVGE
jgi:hypothetical protein